MKHRHILIAPAYGGGYCCATCPWAENFYGEPMPNPYYPGDSDSVAGRTQPAGNLP